MRFPALRPPPLCQKIEFLRRLKIQAAKKPKNLSWTKNKPARNASQASSACDGWRAGVDPVRSKKPMVSAEITFRTSFGVDKIRVLRVEYLHILYFSARGLIRLWRKYFNFVITRYLG